MSNVIRFKFRRSPIRNVGEGEEKLPDEQKLVEFYLCNTINHFHVQVSDNSGEPHKAFTAKPVIRKAGQCDDSCQSDEWSPDFVQNHHWIVQMMLLADFEKLIMFQPDPEPLELNSNEQNQPAEWESIVTQAVIQTIVIHYRVNGRECIQTVPVDYRNQANEMIAVGGLLIPEPWMVIAGPIKNAYDQMIAKLSEEKTS
ncbi:MAG: hypothetical protein WCI57_03460 [Candidatus Berkelbacteria bacterium]